MSNTKTTSLPDGFNERSAAWHLARFIEFTKYKMEIGEPSPHLTIVGHMSRNSPIRSRLWLLGCYAATYCLPTAQVLWEKWTPEEVQKNTTQFETWLSQNWPGIVTRQERRCVRTPRKMAVCLQSYITWMNLEYPMLKEMGGESAGMTREEYYELVWESVSKIKYFGRYINIRLVEGLRRYCDIPARLYDIRSIGGWSPKKCLAYLYPKHAERLLIDDKAGNDLTNKLAYELLAKVQKECPKCDEYILAAMLCEYKGAFEKRHQFVGWTISQEPDLYRKVKTYWGGGFDDEKFWKARSDLFPHETLEEFNDWEGMRWELAAMLRDHGTVWSDLLYDFDKTKEKGDFSKPVRRAVAKHRK